MSFSHWLVVCFMKINDALLIRKGVWFNGTPAGLYLFVLFVYVVRCMSFFYCLNDLGCCCCRCCCRNSVVGILVLQFVSRNIETLPLML